MDRVVTRWPPPRLDASALMLRASRLKLVISDVDGVLTDGGVYYSAQGEELKRFSVRDGMGVERLRAQGIETALLTREPSATVARRADKLRIRLVYLGVAEKKLFLPRILEDAGVNLDQLAYIGDDVNDSEVMEAIAERGLIGAPADARPEIRQMAHHPGLVPGGLGAFREFAEWLLELRAAADRSGRLQAPEDHRLAPEGRIPSFSSIVSATRSREEGEA